METQQTDQISRGFRLAASAHGHHEMAANVFVPLGYRLRRFSIGGLDVFDPLDGANADAFI